MLDKRTQRGENFACFHAGPMAQWNEFRLEPPAVPIPSRGKQFLQALLGSKGLEISLNVVQPGKGVPFLHRHRDNDEIYLVIGGRGQFLVDGQCLDVAVGSVLRVATPAARAWRNPSEAPFYFLCIQYRADSTIEGGTRDGVKVEGAPVWPSGS